MARISYTEGYDDQSVIKQIWDLDQKVKDPVTGEVDTEISSESTNPVENRAIAEALETKQDVLTAGQNIVIVDNVISASGGGGGSVDVDNELSPTSPNPVANATLYQALAGKQAVGDYATNTALAQGLATKQDVGDYATISALQTGLAGKQDAGDYATTSALQTGLAGKQNVLTAGTGISISNDTISTTDGGWETLNLSNLPTDFAVGDELEIGLKADYNTVTGGSSWTTTLNPSTNEIVATSASTIYVIRACVSTMISSHLLKNVLSTPAVSIFSMNLATPTNLNRTTSGWILTLYGQLYNGVSNITISTRIERDNLATYVTYIKRRRI